MSVPVPATPDLAAAERMREHLTTETFPGGCMAFAKADVRAVLDDLDRRGSMIAALLAECERREITGFLPAHVPIVDIRRVLRGDET